jgi:hypothetical protein
VPQHISRLDGWGRAGLQLRDSGPYGNRSHKYLAYPRVEIDCLRLPISFISFYSRIYCFKMTSESCNQPHPGEEFTRDSDFTIEPDRGQCHVYMIHQSGKIYWKPNQQWEGNSTNAEGDTISLDNRLTLMSVSRCLFLQHVH